mgnify:CR=1 FL=1
MALFASLSERLNHIFSKLTKRGKLTELEIRTAMREVRVALLEADVNLKVAKQFIAEVSEKAVGQEILSSLNPAQQVIKIVNDELIALMGSKNAKIEVSPKLPTVIMMCGLQGAGKTTLCGKLALLLKKQGKRPLLVAGDVYRPAAIAQLQVVGRNAGVEVFEKGTQNPVKTAGQAIEYARSGGYDTVILDTAGRLQIDETLMQELENIKKQVDVTETLLVVDAMTGQEAVNVAETFNARLDVTGVILTKLDARRRVPFDQGGDGQADQVHRRGRETVGFGAVLSRAHGVPNSGHGRRAFADRESAADDHGRGREEDAAEDEGELLHAERLSRTVCDAEKDGGSAGDDEHATRNE